MGKTFFTAYSYIHLEYMHHQVSLQKHLTLKCNIDCIHRLGSSLSIKYLE